MTNRPPAIVVAAVLLAAAAAASACHDAGGPPPPESDETRVTAVLPFGGVGAWVGTHDGTLARLDSAPTIVDPPDDPAWGSVRALAYDGSDLVVAAGSGLFRLGGSGWASLGPSGDGALPVSLAGGPGGVWVGRGHPNTGSGSLARLGSEAWTLHDHTTVIESASMVNQVVLDTEGGVWAATNAAGVVHRGPAGDWALFDISTGALRSDRVLDLAADPLGGVWVATQRGVTRLTVGGTEPAPEEALPDLRARALAVTADAVWVGTVNGGIARLGRASGSWQVVRPTEEEAASITHLAVTPDGAAWAGTAGDGLLRFAADGSTRPGFREGEGQVSALAVSGEIVWAGTYGGAVYRLIPSASGLDAERFRVAGGEVDAPIDGCPAGPGPIEVPAGWFLMGSDEGRPDEAPQRRVYVDAFAIGRHEVTNAEYLCFGDATGAPPAAAWPGGAYLFGEARFPVAGLRPEEAAAYCAWAGGRLPTEAEWEKAARGVGGRTWPWGEAWDPARANSAESARGRPVEVGSFPHGASLYGALDMAGNLEEWVADYYQPDYYRNAPDRNPPGPAAVTNRVRRGGSWADGAGATRTSYRTSSHGSSPDFRAGFRCAFDR